MYIMSNRQDMDFTAQTVCPVAGKTRIALLLRLLLEGVFFPAQQASWYRDLEAAGLEDFRFHDLRNT